MPPEQELDVLARSHATLCIFLSAHKLTEVAEKLAEHYGSQCPVAVVHRASWPDQQIFRGTLADIADKTRKAAINKTAMIIVGPALSRDTPVSKLYDPAFSHEYRIGKKA
jgi:precorrin-4/cobalt-precorrin-4 C11-methyltransferase